MCRHSRQPGRALGKCHPGLRDGVSPARCWFSGAWPVTLTCSALLHGWWRSLQNWCGWGRDGAGWHCGILDLTSAHLLCLYLSLLASWPTFFYFKRRRLSEFRLPEKETLKQRFDLDFVKTLSKTLRQLMCLGWVPRKCCQGA